MKITHYLYNAFLIEENGARVAIDPGQNLWIFELKRTPRPRGDAGCRRESMTVTLDGVKIDAVRTVHGPIAVPVLGFTLRAQPGPDERVGIGSMGFRITIGDVSILNLGDSVLLPEWRDISVDVLMLPIGGFGQGTWTMDVDEALDAVRMIAPKHVIPCHYSVPFLWRRHFAVADDQRFKREVERLGLECSILKYGETLTL